MKKKVAISIGDINGVGIEIALKAHDEISKLCTPIYCINETILQNALSLLHIKKPDNFTLHNVDGDFTIKAGEISKESGLYSYNSFMSAIELAQTKKVDAIVTMPIHKEAWSLAGLEYKGHTDLLRKHFNKEAIMMLGCEELYVALYTEHMPLKEVSKEIKEEKLFRFFCDFIESVGEQKVAVLGLNPHAGDNGVLGDEEKEIENAIKKANTHFNKELFYGAIVPDVAFTPHFRKNFHYMIAMYHDQGLAPLKALYFDESVNISLNLPIVRTSVDHGTAFDIAYKGEAKTLSYVNAIKSALELSFFKDK